MFFPPILYYSKNIGLDITFKPIILLLIYFIKNETTVAKSEATIKNANTPAIILTLNLFAE